MISPQLNSITRLARAGALEQAWSLFHASRFTPGSDDPEVLTVYGRLLKDRAAQATGAVRGQLLHDAIAAYERASILSRATYPLINAATLAFLAGLQDKANRLAQATLALLDSQDCAPETPYWIDATRAESLLLLGRTDDAQRLLGKAIAHQPDAWEDHASTLRQFSMILRGMGQPDGWLDRYRPRAPLYFDGILGIATDDAQAAAIIEDAVEALSPSIAIGALAAGADILVAEAAIRLGSELHIVLPCPAGLFRTTSVEPFGPGWAGRFDVLMDEAVSVLMLDDWHALSDASIDISRQAAMGLAIRQAKRLQSSPQALHISAKGEEERSRAAEPWHRLDLPLSRVRMERSDRSQAVLPGQGKAMALLSVPEAWPLEPDEGDGAVLLGRTAGHVVLGMPRLADAAAWACAIRVRHPEARLGIDYCAVADDGTGDQGLERAVMLARADLTGAVALSESAALALALHWPEANVQSMGAMRGIAGDRTLYGLFPGSGDQVG